MTRVLPLSIAALTTSVLFGGAVAMAQPMPERGEMTREQATERAAQAFARMDVNDDGVLDPADREAAMRQRFDAADTDGNGQLSFAEVTAAQESRRATRDERRAERAERGAGRPAMRRLLARGMGPIGEGRMFERADADSDGSVSQAEFTAEALARFDRADANGDGTISRDERRALRGMGRGEGRGERGGWRRPQG